MDPASGDNTEFEHTSEIANLQEALSSARRIGAAVGIVMAMTGRTEPQAFDHLVGLSQSRHRKVRDIADWIVSTGKIPER